MIKTDKIVVERLEQHLEGLIKLGEEYTRNMTPPPTTSGDRPDFEKLLKEVMVAEQFGDTLKELVILHQLIQMDREDIRDMCKSEGKSPQELALAIMLDSVLRN